jgi:hypothetical protein
MLAWLSVNAVVGLWLQHAPHLLTLRALTREQVRRRLARLR